MPRIWLLLACMTALTCGADITLQAAAGSGSSLVVTMHLTGAPAFATSGALIRFDRTRLNLTSQAAGTYGTFIADTRPLADINASGEIRFGTFAFADHPAGDGTLGSFTLQPIAGGAAAVTTVLASPAEPFGCMLQTLGGSSIIPNLVGLPISVSPTPGSNLPPSITSAGATPGTVTGNQTTLAAIATDDAGESALTYAWSAPVVPAGGTATFSITGSNAAKSSVATFTRAGSYVLRVMATDAGFLSAEHDVAVTVEQTATSLSVSPVVPTVTALESRAFSAQALDQFTAPMGGAPAAIVWSLDAGSAGRIAANGIYTAAEAGTATVRATSGAITAAVAITIVRKTNDGEVIDGSPGDRDPSGCGMGSSIAVLLALALFAWNGALLRGRSR